MQLLGGPASWTAETSRELNAGPACLGRESRLRTWTGSGSGREAPYSPWLPMDALMGSWQPSKSVLGHGERAC